ncbi:unnamed protein product [Brachionus calyciflorus]|uniref:Uncharacterized protein n=1 Tax=Brachionus calyciflorus TaxID=104777 RepID=A0A813M864_9BILA|nr:unnamed protein product [Brachionus calyciflorus]
MIFLNTNSNYREAINPQIQNQNRKPSNQNLTQNVSSNKLQKSRNSISKSKNQDSCAEISAKILAVIGSLGLLAGIGLLVFGVIEFIKDFTSVVGIASIASGSFLVFASGVSIIIVICILCTRKNQISHATTRYK